jgi:hypothetical protein
MSGPLADPEVLAGRWLMSRTIEDRLAGQSHHVDGLLQLTVVEPGRIRWREEGLWRQPSGDVEVERTLWLVRGPDGPWWVRFEDEREFHPWAPGAPVVHDCRPDTYRGVVSGDDRTWTVRWDVNGPRKDYTMTTVLVPEGR